MFDICYGLEETQHDCPNHPGKPKPLRPMYGECPGCGAADGEWCQADCPTVDLLDHQDCR